MINELLIAATIASTAALGLTVFKLKTAKEETAEVWNKNNIFLDEASNWRENAGEYREKWLEAFELLEDNETKSSALSCELDKLEAENKRLRKSLEEISGKKYFEMGRYPAPYIAPVPPWSIAERALAK